MKHEVIILQVIKDELFRTVTFLKVPEIFDPLSVEEALARIEQLCSDNPGNTYTYVQCWSLASASI